MDLPSMALWQAFADGQQFLLEDGTLVATQIRDAAPLVLPSGRIVIADPILDPYQKPLSVAVAADSYPVFLSLIEDQVALVMVHFTFGTPVRWKATRPRCVAVDSARACLMDDKVGRFLYRRMKDGKYDKYARRFEDAVNENDGLWGSVASMKRRGPTSFYFKPGAATAFFPPFSAMQQMVNSSA